MLNKKEVGFFEKLNTIRKTYGNTPQLIVAMEEMAELTQEISKLITRKNKKETRHRIIMEMADVRIMLLHIEKILKLGDKDVWNAMEIKINKHYDMIMNNKSDVETKGLK